MPPYKCDTCGQNLPEPKKHMFSELEHNQKFKWNNYIYTKIKRCSSMMLIIDTELKVVCKHIYLNRHNEVCGQANDFEVVPL